MLHGSPFLLQEEPHSCTRDGYPREVPPVTMLPQQLGISGSNTTICVHPAFLLIQVASPGAEGSV